MILLSNIKIYIKGGQCFSFLLVKWFHELIRDSSVFSCDTFLSCICHRKKSHFESTQMYVTMCSVLFLYGDRREVFQINSVVLVRLVGGMGGRGGGVGEGG